MHPKVWGFSFVASHHVSAVTQVSCLLTLSLQPNHKWVTLNKYSCWFFVDSHDVHFIRSKKKKLNKNQRSFIQKRSKAFRCLWTLNTYYYMMFGMHAWTLNFWHNKIIIRFVIYLYLFFFPSTAAFNCYFRIFLFTYTVHVVDVRHQATTSTNQTDIMNHVTEFTNLIGVRVLCLACVLSLTMCDRSFDEVTMNTEMFRFTFIELDY